ncbi:MAG: SurA N-terminal domain-containing protein [bacterium]|nr:SurA N-terminal domain-containing protein [bacterium]
MSLEKYFTTFLLILFVGLGAYYMVHFGYYPVAIVNSSLVTANRFETEYAVAYHYYLRALGSNKDSDPRSRGFKRELRRAVLEDLVDQSLIKNDLVFRVGKDLPEIVENKIMTAQKIDLKTIEETAKMLYGLSLADFKSLVLVPQAQKEILQGRLFLEKKDYEKWLQEAKKNAKVFIVTPEFYWQDMGVKLRD